MKYCVYILTNKTNSVLYVGVTNNLERRLLEHRNSIDEKSFVARYKCHKLIYYIQGNNIEEAIKFEKRVKGWSREKKHQLIVSINPKWRDLSEGWF